MRVQPARAAVVLCEIPLSKIAVDLGYSRGWVSKVLNGVVPPPAEFKQKLSEYLDLPMSVLFDGDDS